MSLAYGDFVDGNTPDALQAGEPKAFKKGAFLNVLDRIPAQSNNGRDILDGCGAQQKENILLQAFRVPFVEAGKGDFYPADEAAITARDTWNGPSNDDLFVSDGRCLKVSCTASTPNNVGPVACRTSEQLLGFNVQYDLVAFKTSGYRFVALQGKSMIKFT